jgi:hypothetical protein
MFTSLQHQTINNATTTETFKVFIPLDCKIAHVLVLGFNCSLNLLIDAGHPAAMANELRHVPLEVRRVRLNPSNDKSIMITKLAVY